MAEFPSLPLFTDAFIADTLHLDDADRGRYVLLLMMIWRSPECRVPNDDAWLAPRFGRSVERFRQEVRPLIEQFCQTTGNWVTQKRLSKEFSRAKDQSKKQSVRAKSRWDNKKDDAAGYAAPGNATPGNAAPGNAPNPNKKESKKESPELVIPSETLDRWRRDYPHVAMSAVLGLRKWARDKGLGLDSIERALSRKEAEALAKLHPPPKEKTLVERIAERSVSEAELAEARAVNDRMRERRRGQHPPG